MAGLSAPTPKLAAPPPTLGVIPSAEAMGAYYEAPTALHQEEESFKQAQAQAQLDLQR